MCKKGSLSGNVKISTFAICTPSPTNTKGNPIILARFLLWTAGVNFATLHQAMALSLTLSRLKYLRQMAKLFGCNPISLMK